LRDNIVRGGWNMKQSKKTRGGETATPTIEARGFPRYPFSTSAEAIDIHGNTKITGRTSDIGQKGCYIGTISPFAPKSTVALRITRDNRSFETKATVVYSQVGMGMGLAFTSSEFDQLRVLDTWLAELSGERVCPIDSPPLHFHATQNTEQVSHGVLGEMILLLVHKAVITEAEGKAMLQKLFK
jgi:PilZ domain